MKTRCPMVALVVVCIAGVPMLTSGDEGRRIPDDNLAYPVMVDLPGSFGSGFYLDSGAGLYLVSAKHVLLDQTSGQLLSPTADVTSIARDPSDPTRIRLRLDLVGLLARNQIRAHASHDVAVIRVGTPQAANSTASKYVTFLPGVTLVSTAPSGLISAGMDVVARYSSALVANEIIVFGYPKSLGLKEQPQFDYSQPLLRSGIIAAKNSAQRTLVLDCFTYPGNSGGPVLEFVGDWPGRQLRIVGVVTQFVPVLEEWRNITRNYTNVNVGNSGYSIAEPMDFVLDLVAEMERQPPSK